MTYHLTYAIEPHPEGIEKDQIPEGHGACSALIIASIIYPPGGGLSLEMTSHDGRADTDLADLEYFKVWAMLAHNLSASDTLSRNKRELCRLVHETIKAVILANRGADDDDGCLYAEPHPRTGEPS